MKKAFLFIVLFMVAESMATAQNIGIGTKAPAEKLHVDGNIKSDTLKPNAIKLSFNAGNGKILTSDADGNASWQKINNAFAVESSLSSPGNIGYGVWGDCATNGNISEYQPVADTTGVGGLRFGHSVSVFGNFAIAGAWGDDVGTNLSQGSANIYHYDGTKWVLMQKLTDVTGAAGDEFGYSVSISDKYAIIGARRDDVGANTDQGSVSIYQYDGVKWILMQKLTDVAGAANDYFGNSVSISGGFVIVGSCLDDQGASTNQGSALFYRYNGANWIFAQKVFDAAGLPGNQFGFSVSISGNYAIVGALNYDVGSVSGYSEGAAVVYQYNGTNWVFMQRITDNWAAANDNFGYSVSISGNYAIVGAPYDDHISYYDAGSANIFQRNGNTWVLIEKIDNANAFDTDFFGFSVSISGNYAMVGCLEDNIEVNNIFNNAQGSASIYQRVGKGWQRLQYFTDPGGKAGDGFGICVSVDEVTKRFIAGVKHYANGAGKIVFGKIN